MSACIDYTHKLTIKTHSDEMRSPKKRGILATGKETEKQGICPLMSPMLISGTNFSVIYKEMTLWQIPVKPRSNRN